MKTEIVELEVKNKVEFPLIAKCITLNIDNGAIVLFYSEKEGTVIHQPNESGAKLGEFSNRLVSCFDLETFEILDEVTINFKS